MADGLPSGHVTCKFLDSHGFLWFCTPEGLSRFDGYTFTNYGVDQGLPDRVVTDFLETRGGEYFVGTARGMARFNPKPGPKQPLFTTIASGSNELVPVLDLKEDRQGAIWVAMGGYGLRQIVRSNGQWVMHIPDPNVVMGPSVEGLMEDDAGDLWIVVYGDFVGAALWRRTPDGHFDKLVDEFLRKNRITSILQDRHKNIWIGTYNGLGVLAPNPRPGQKLVSHVYAKWDGQQSPEMGGIFESRDGRLWVGSMGVYQIIGNPQTEPVHFKLFDKKSYPPDLEDIDGNLWQGERKEANELVDYDTTDGLATEDVRSIFEGHDGELYVVSGLHSRYIHRWDGKRFVSVIPYVPNHSSSWDWQGWGWGQIHLQDHNGEWWFATGYGLLRYPKVKRLEDLAHTPPKAFYKKNAGVFRLFEDSAGNIWIGAWGGSGFWERATERVRFFDQPGGIVGEPTAFAEDRAGNIWIALWGGGVQRYRQGKFEWVVQAHVPPGMVNSLFADHAGRMWAGSTRSGLMRFDDPTAEHPTFRTYLAKDGISSNDVRAITEDHFGRIYFWTGLGVDRLDPDTGRIRKFNEADGLVRPYPDHNVAFCDRHGTLWFGLDGISRLDPQPDRPPRTPPIRITRIRIRGVDYPISELGETDLPGLVLAPNENQLQIEFSSLNFAFGEVIKYQYKLDGADQDWSAPTEQRTVTFPRLSSGRYRFLVRAINSEGLISSVPAAIGFRLMPPVWMRWWFLTSVAFVIAADLYWLYRLRLRQLLELERVRTRIASDLHDDIGSSLTQIAIMSEVVRRQNGHHDAEPLERIADLARNLVDSMSDIVWAINPKRDQLSDLVQRMRRFASDVLESADIEVEFHAPSEQTDVPLHADMRRELFLIFKESVNNAARHARCRRVNICVELKDSRFLMSIGDDGQGFPPNPGNGQGHGLQSMRERARRLGGDITFVSANGNGTTLSLFVPLDYSSFSIHRPSARA